MKEINGLFSLVIFGLFIIAICVPSVDLAPPIGREDLNPNANELDVIDPRYALQVADEKQDELHRNMQGANNELSKTIVNPETNAERASVSLLPPKTTLDDAQPSPTIQSVSNTIESKMPEANVNFPQDEPKVQQDAKSKNVEEIQSAVNRLVEKPKDDETKQQDVDSKVLTTQKTVIEDKSEKELPGAKTDDKDKHNADEKIEHKDDHEEPVAKPEPNGAKAVVEPEPNGAKAVVEPEPNGAKAVVEPEPNGAKAVVEPEPNGAKAVVQPVQKDTNPGVTPEQKDTNPGVTPEQKDTNPGVTPEQKDTNPGVTPEQKDTNPGVTPEQKDTNPGVTPEQKDTNPEVTPEHKNTKPEVTPEQKDTKPGVKPNLENAKPEVKPNLENAKPEVETKQEVPKSKDKSNQDAEVKHTEGENTEVEPNQDLSIDGPQEQPVEEANKKPAIVEPKEKPAVDDPKEKSSPEIHNDEPSKKENIPNGEMKSSSLPQNNLENIDSEVASENPLITTNTDQLNYDAAIDDVDKMEDKVLEPSPNLNSNIDNFMKDGDSKGGLNLPPQTDTGYFPEQEDNHFFAYFVTAVLIFAVGYLLIHNKQKILAMIVEGRGGRRRRRSHVYKRLETDSNKFNQIF